MFDENGQPAEYPLDDIVSAPDAHLLFVSPEHERDVRQRERTSGRRGGRRGVRGVRGQPARGGGYPGRRVRHEWEGGHPLHEIYMTDADVPSELKRLVVDLVSRRQARGNTARDNAGDEFFDADDGGDSLPRLETNFEWSPMDSFRGQEEVFKPERTGSVQVFDSAYDAFRSYWSDDI